MLQITVPALRLRPQAVLLLMLSLVLGSASDAVAVFDFQVPNGAYNVSGNWIDYVSGDTTGVPADGSEAVVRNGGTLNITAADGNASADLIRIGAGPLGTDPVGPPFYGGTGTLNFTGGNILGDTFGPRLHVGRRDDANNINYTGIVNQSGGKISLNTVLAFLVVGASGTTTTPTSIYNLSGGTIGVTAGSGNTNRGIDVRNGTFNMTGGQIISDDNPLNPNTSTRAMTLSTASGPAGSENTAYANFSGGTVYTYGGLAVGNSANSKGYVTISGTANLHFRAVDVQLGVNQSNSLGQIDMSGGTFKVGDPTLPAVPGPGVQDRRFIIGDSGTGVFNMSGGTAIINHSMVVCNRPATAKGTFYQTGGTFTVRDIETNRNTPTAADLSIENAAIIIDGPTAVFNQQNTVTPDGVLTGELTLGRAGNGRFEIRQGQANIRQIDISDLAQSRATLNVFGGKLKLQDGIFRNNITNDGIDNNTPNINLTGGELELAPVAPTPDAMSWNPDLYLNGTDFDPKPGAVMLTNVGSFPNKASNFSMNAGTVWDLNIAGGTEFDADRVDVPNGTGALNGGTLNIIPINGYTPANGDTVRILHALNSVTMNAAAVSVSDPRWQLQLDAINSVISLKFVASATLAGDYNNNGKVDAADYVMWRNNPSAFGGTPAGYNTWRANFGKPPGSGSSFVGAGSAVPEPTTIVLVGLFASISLVSRRARGGKR